MKDLIVEKVDVWSAPIEDRPGGLAKILTSLKDAGVDLNFILSRRAPDKPGAGVVFVTPLRGDREIGAASGLGFNVIRSLASLQVEGPNRRGIAAEVTEKLASVGLNLHGFSGATIGGRFVLYIGFDSPEDAAKAAAILKEE